ncbi:MAG TPA: patatin-like phospholipase family protein [Solirubrobacteraceae bacterium]|jgi:NTE family protein|nr:patatin-like phospholipase family protein [Solirubrobacteraceae bacterium]
MGSVVKLEDTSHRGRTRGKRRRASRTALVLGGGGFTGGVYEIGALRALDLLAVNSNANDFDIYVGTSAGAFIAALAANRVSPEEMMRVATREGPQPFRDIALGDLLHPNVGEMLARGAKLPLRIASIVRQIVLAPSEVSVMDLLLELGQALPSGLYTGAGIEGYLRKVLSEPGRTDDFRQLRGGRELYITATDLDTCERIVFGGEGFDEVPISTAVRASGALPMVYAPVKLDGRELVDGGITSTTNLDIAVEAGAKFVVVINPVMPFVNDFATEIRTLRGRRPRRVSDMGLPQIGYQAFKLLAHHRLHEMAAYWGERYPGVDIVLIEPNPDDELMFRTSIMNFASRIAIARHGFESVAQHLAGRYDYYQEVAQRHGIELSAERLRMVVEHFETVAAAEEAERDGNDTSAWRRILEGTGALLG